MSEFLKLLSFYYLCDAAAAERHLTAEEVAACSRTYSEVKTHFAGLAPMPTGTRAVAQRNRDAYLAFKAWESQNQVLVAQLKRDAIR